MRARLAVAAVTLLSLATAAAASPPLCLQESEPFTLKNTAIVTGEEVWQNLSGLACAPQEGGKATCVLVYDEDFSAFGATLAGRTLTMNHHGVIAAREQDRRTELDAEGAAFDGGAFYVIGSHGVKHKSCKPNPSSHQLLRLVPKADGGWTSTSTAKVTAVLRSIPEIAPKVDQCHGTVGVKNKSWTPAQGSNVEGLAIKDGQAFIGLRGPVLSGQALVVETALDALFELGAAWTGSAKLHRLTLAHGGGVRDLASAGEHIVIIEGSEDDDVGQAVLHLWDGTSPTMSSSCAIPDPPAKSKDKPEAALVLGRDGDTLRVLVLSDGPDYGNPRVFRLPVK